MPTIEPERTDEIQPELLAAAFGEVSAKVFGSHTHGCRNRKHHHREQRDSTVSSDDQVALDGAWDSMSQASTGNGQMKMS